MQSQSDPIYQLALDGTTSRITSTGRDSAFACDGEHHLVVDRNLTAHVPSGVVVHQYCSADETDKTLTTVETILHAMLERGLARDSVLVAVGGGVMCDMAAFAASIYMRGVKCILVPSTLLAMVDAAVGGKTGVNFGGYKNLVGTFAPASEIRVCPGFLSSLSDREYRSGLAEVIKAGLIGDAGLVSLLAERRDKVLSRDEESLRELIHRAIRVKCEVVQEDFRESGRRAHLNLGHTFGHALEAVAGFGTWTHGEAVAWGIGCAVRLSVQMGLAPQDYAAEVEALLSSYGFRLESGLAADELIAAMQADKKKHAGTVRFILQAGPQQTLQREAPEKAVRQALR